MPADLTDLFREYGFTLKQKTAEEWSSACPVCGGSKRCSLWPGEGEGRGYYWCRECGAKGDGIQFLRDYAGMSYADACKRIGVAAAAPVVRTPKLSRQHAGRRFEPVRDRQSADTVDREKWCAHAEKFSLWAADCLQRSPEHLAWLAARGIDAASAARYRLGYNPGEKGRNCIIRPRSSWGLPDALRDDGKPRRLWLPRGIVIPQIEEGAVRRLRIRRLDSDREKFNPAHKYHVVEGSEMQPLWLECTAPLREGQGAVVVVETELDAFMLHALAGDLVHALALGTCNVARLPAWMFDRLKDSLVILVALDADAAGAEGWLRWRQTFPTARRWPVPAGKDPGDAFARGEDMRIWLLSGLPEGLRLTLAAQSLASNGSHPPENETPPDAPCPPPDENMSEISSNAADTAVPPVVLHFWDMWKTCPVFYRRERHADGRIKGYGWEYPQRWARKNFEKLHALLLFFDTHPELWRWVARNRHDRFSARRFLDVLPEEPMHNEQEDLS